MAIDQEKLKKILEEIRGDVDRRTRITQIDNFINPPTVKEVDAAIFDALQDINSFEPMTSFSIEGIHADADGRWYRALTLGSAKNIVQMLIFDWTAHGMDVDLGDGVALASRLSDYESLRSALSDEFVALVERLKASTQRHVNLQHFHTLLKDRDGNQSSFGKRARTRRLANRLSR